MEITEKQKNCKHKNTKYGYMWLKEIRRQTIRCKDCGLLLDYIPQYNTD